MTIKVEATKRGYYGVEIREPGSQFDIQSEKEFSKRWMKRVEEPKAEKAGNGKKGRGE